MYHQQSFHTLSSRLRDSESFMWRVAAPSEESPEGQDADASLEDAAQSEQEYVRERLRRELQREPTEDELSEWLREHTEGY